MANTKISALTADTAPTADDLVVTVNDPGGTPATKKATITNFTKAIPAVIGDSGSGGTKGLVPAPGAGDAAAGKYLDAAGAYSVPAGTGPSTGASYITKVAEAGLSNEFALGSLATGILKNTTTTGVPTISDANDISSPVYAADAGSNDTYVATLSPVPSAYVSGAHYRFKANTANTGACTINFNSLGAKTIKKAVGGITTDLDDNDIRAGQWVDLVYDGTNMQMQSTLGNAASTLTQEQVEDFVGALIVAGSGISATYNDGAGTLTIANTSPGVAADSLLPALTAPPTVSNWTWVNQGTATAGDVTIGNRAGVYLHSNNPAGAGANQRILKRSAPGTPYIITACLFLGQGAFDFNNVGIGWRQSSDGKLVLFETEGSSSGGDLRVYKWSSPTSGSAQYRSRNTKPPFGVPFWMRIQDDGTNRKCYWSADGVNFVLLHSVGRTDFMTADEVVISVNTESTNTYETVSLTLVSWAIT